MNISGILIVNKPRNLTSFNVIDKIKKKFNINKICHCGTLDPLATGVLIVCFGNKIKTVSQLFGLKKRYIVHVIVGIKSSTADIYGKINFFEKKNIECKIKNIKYTFKSLTKCTYQKPPLFSSIKHNKISLYKYARLEIDTNVRERKIKIYEIKLREIFNNKFVLDIQCSKGTYVRGIVEYLGTKLSVPMCVTDIIRISSGEYNILQSYPLNKILEFKNIPNLKKIIL